MIVPDPSRKCYTIVKKRGKGGKGKGKEEGPWMISSVFSLMFVLTPFLYLPQ